VVDVFSELTISGISNALFSRYGCYDEIYEVSGPIQQFIMKSCSGGRTMISDNKPHIADRKQVDFDWNSLYPSAILHMKVMQGVPHILVDKSFEFLSTTAGYVVECSIRKNKDIKRVGFPLLAKFEDHRLNYTNDWNPEDTVILNDEQIADLITYQHYTIEDFTVLQGLYYSKVDQRHEISASPIDENHEMRMKVSRFGFIMKMVYLMRVEYKKQRNPIQLVLKLLMNTSYGRNIMKMSELKTSYKNQKSMNNVIKRNFINLKESTKIKDDLHLCTCYVNKYEHFNRAIVGSFVLSKSKTLFHEMTDLIEDWSNISYMDTDSLQGSRDEILKTIAKMNVIKNARYGTVGLDYVDHKFQGGSHIDLPKVRCTAVNSYLDEKNERVYFDDVNIGKSVEPSEGNYAIYLSKKCYFIELNTENMTDVYQDEFNLNHIRMKGVSKKSIRAKLAESYSHLDISLRVRQLYLDLYNNKLSIAEIEQSALNEKQKRDKINKYKMTFTMPSIKINKKTNTITYEKMTRRQ
jgi:hypothetical protein